MKRRTFLKISSGTLAAAGLTNILRAQSAVETPYTYKYFDSVAKTSFALTFFESGINNFNKSDQTHKTLTLEVTFKDASGVDKVGKYTTEIVSCTQDDSVKSKYTIKGSPIKKLSGDDTLPTDFPKEFNAVANITNSIYTSSFSIKTDSGTSYAELKPPGSADSYDYDDLFDCFLTSACVGQKGLPDNCHELETLRAFRDDYMKQLSEGKQLIEDYYQVGPAVVSSINNRPNHAAIYDHIFDTLVIPSVKLVENKAFPEAMQYYRDYVLELKKQLGNHAI